MRPAKEDIRPQAIRQSAGGWTTNIHTAADDDWRAVIFSLALSHQSSAPWNPNQPVMRVQRDTVACTPLVNLDDLCAGAAFTPLETRYHHGRCIWLGVSEATSPILRSKGTSTHICGRYD